MQVESPASVEVDSTMLGGVGPVMQAYVDAGKIAGINTLVARHGKVVHLESFGHANIESGVRMQPDTVLRIYSMSKPITIVAALMLYERGLYSLNDPIADYIPAFSQMMVATEGGGTVPASQPLTIRHLMTHTSGISYGAEGTPAEEAYTALRKKSPGETLPTAQVIDEIAALPLVFQPGEHWHYGLSTDVVGRLVEVVSGKRFGLFLEEELFGPLGMTDTGFAVQTGSEERLAALYEPQEPGRKDLDNNLQLVGEPEQSLGRCPRPFESGGGGLVSTVVDYGRFAQMLVNGGSLDGVRILGRKTVSLMASKHINAQHEKDYDWPDHRGYTFGLGVRVMGAPADGGSNGSVGEFGWAGLAGTWVWVDPAEDMIALFMPQLIPDMYYPAAREFITIVNSAVL